MKIRSFVIYILIVFFAISSTGVSATSNLYAEKYADNPGFVEKQKFIDLFTFDELIKLYEYKELPPELNNKLSTILYNPIIDNTIAKPEEKLNNDKILGKFVRIAAWNIQRGLPIDDIELILKQPDKFLTKVKNQNKKIKKDKIEKIKKEIEVLRNSDIFILNEVDIGMPRTNYKNIAKEFANILGFNYAFGVEFIEIEPSALGLSSHTWSEVNLLFKDGEYIVDKSKYKGLHGNAILSKYPLENVRIIRLPQHYDWFNSEKNKVRLLTIEQARRKGAKFIFDETVLTEVRRGGRMALVADVQLPEIDQPITVISVHLENRVIPKNRYKQISFLLEEIKDIENPVVLGGDFNTTTKDGAPTTLFREFKKKIVDFDFIAKQTTFSLIPYGYLYSSGQLLTNLLKTYKDPTAINIPVISPNKERKLFKTIKNLEFTDEGKFDFSGEKYRSNNNRKGLLANSNERAFKGFKPTFAFNRDLKVARLKLDWIFVKPGELTCEEENLRQFMPFYGRTMFDLNYASKHPISDHTPITVDLPLDPPSKDKVKELLKD